MEVYGLGLIKFATEVICHLKIALRVGKNELYAPEQLHSKDTNQVDQSSSENAVFERLYQQTARQIQYCRHFDR